MLAQSPIIMSFLDTDAYKLHMQQAVFHQTPSTVASYEFRCRNPQDCLGVYAKVIQEEINRMADVMLSDEEYDYLSSLPHFRKDYLDYLRSYRYKPAQVHIRVVPPVDDDGLHLFNEDGSELHISIDGPWVETILWEIPLLAIISEATQRARCPDVGVPEALESLREKLCSFFAHHSQEELATFKMSDFGTRRRFSRDVQEAVVRALQADERFAPHLVGTSNYDLARRLNLPAIGTQAHEWFQAYQQLSPRIRLSQTLALERWLQEYPDSLGIALTDCITMDSFLDDFSERLARQYVGLRQDSGSPEEWGRKALSHYRSLNIDPKAKMLVFSDGLDLEMATDLYNMFKEETNVMCGIGTQLTCSIKGVRPMNIVVKMVRCQGRPVAKVSDSPGKLMCEDIDYVEKLLRAYNVPLDYVSPTQKKTPPLPHST